MVQVWVVDVVVLVMSYGCDRLICLTAPYRLDESESTQGQHTTLMKRFQERPIRCRGTEQLYNSQTVTLPMALMIALQASWRESVAPPMASDLASETRLRFQS